jgi:hypothetical protein
MNQYSLNKMLHAGSIPGFDGLARFGGGRNWIGAAN